MAKAILLRESNPRILYSKASNRITVNGISVDPEWISMMKGKVNDGLSYRVTNGPNDTVLLKQVQAMSQLRKAPDFVYELG